MEAKQRRFKILMFPWLAHGHIFPFLELAKKLSNNNFQILFCSTAINLDSIKQTLNKQPLSSSSHDDYSIELVELHLPSLPDLPPHYHTTKNIPPHLMPTLLKAFQMSSSNFSGIISCLSPDLLIFDAFQPWSAKVASSRGIPSVFFSTSGSAPISFFHHFYTHKSLDSFPYPSIYLTDNEKRDVASAGETIKVDDVDEGFCFGVFKLSHEIVLIKSYRGIEGKYMEYLSSLCDKKILPVGPLITRASDHENRDSNVEGIMDWLNERDESSTLYISFGSENYLSEDQIQEVARGLEMSHVNFIWAARLPFGSEIVLEEALPEGFSDRVRTRGLILKGWAPQAAILAHSSVGGFMSHCGWSSISESLYFGVPVVALPLKLDQPVNCRLLVEAGVAAEVRRDANGRFDGGSVVETINKVFAGESGEGFRRRAREMSEKMKMEEGEAILEVAEELSRLCKKK